jgi:ribosomal protein L11 methyltransferase
MKYPALDVRGADPEVVLAVVDDFAPTAVEELTDGISIFFSSATRRDAAESAVRTSMPDAQTTGREVDDEDWARRSQENLTPVTVGRITVSPPWFARESDQPPTSDLRPPTSDLRITILPSMGFGTGHHPTTRLCLTALQTLDFRGKRVLDVGTGSGVLAIAASALGAREALGIDFDPDAIANARENLDLNPHIQGVSFEVQDLRAAALSPADLVVANLTGAVLIQNARLLSSTVSPGGTLIVSGLQVHEREAVSGAFRLAEVQWSAEEAGWTALTFNFPIERAV